MHTAQMPLNLGVQAARRNAGSSGIQVLLAMPQMKVDGFEGGYGRRVSIITVTCLVFAALLQTMLLGRFHPYALRVWLHEQL